MILARQTPTKETRMSTHNINDTIPASDTITFSIALEGWNPNVPGTDHLVKWINAPSVDALLAFIKREKLVLIKGIEVIHIDEDGWMHNYNDKRRRYNPETGNDVDCTINAQGKLIDGKLGAIDEKPTYKPGAGHGRPRKQKQG